MTAHLYDPSPALPLGMREVGREEFFAVVGPQDVHPTPDVPVTGSSTWVHRTGRVVGRTVVTGKDYSVWPNCSIVKYFLA
jgi:hypothetical protein